MASKGGGRTLKRYAAPRSVKIERKVHVWTTKPVPGPHPQELSIPLRSLVRDGLGLGRTAREADLIINEGKVLVDGVPRREPKFPVGLMDVIQIPSIEQNFRILIDRNGRLFASRIDPSEAGFKLCKVVGKRTLRGGEIQLVFHDGRSMKGAGREIKPMDVVKMDLKERRMIKTLPFQVGALALVTGGANVGRVGRISDVRVISGSQPNIVTLKSDSEEFQAPEKYVFVIGTEEPEIKIQEDRR
jgi:small subunit ribosomal protein S4e